MKLNDMSFSDLKIGNRVKKNNNTGSISNLIPANEHPSGIINGVEISWDNGNKMQYRFDWCNDIEFL